MIDDLKKQIPRYVIITGLVLTALAFVLGGVDIGVGAAVGTVVSILDALALTWLTSRMVVGASFITQGFAAGLLGAKLFALLAVCWALLARWAVNPIGFCVGLGALVLGMLLGAVELSYRQAQAGADTEFAIGGEG